MPSPIGHALGGLIVGLATASRSNPLESSASAGVKALRSYGRANSLTMCAIAACLPDLDFLWGRHNMETHSVGFALLIGVAVFAWTRSTRLGFGCALAVISHVLFDWLGSDDTPPLGVMALWPLSSEFYFADAFVFEAISRRYWLPNFVTHNLPAVAREMAILLPVAAALWWWRGPRGAAG
jgi:membrane-bound metal-dependent hydrolase YbcI (DUF457 family)